MPDLLVRNLQEEIVLSLKKRAALHNRSAEAEHRASLEEALIKTRRKPLAEVLARMPDVGRDEDFERTQNEETAAGVFD